MKKLDAKYTKKDFISIGGILRKHKSEPSIVDDFTQLFKLSNPLFDEQRFREFVFTGKLRGRR